MTATNDDNHPHCPGEATLDEVRAVGRCRTPDYEGGLEAGDHKYDGDGFCIFCGNTSTLDKVRDEYHQLHQVRHGQIAVYPQDHMKRLLSGQTVPRWRRLLRRLRLMK